LTHFFRQGRYLSDMGYRIDYAMRDGMLKVVVSGKSSLEHAASIARDIAEQANRHAVKQLLIDVRSLLGRVGTLGTLLEPRGAMAGFRIAVLDVSDNDPYYVFSENAARMRGRELRYFYDPAAALRWLGVQAE
jgi:hypothetical protein